MLQLKQRIGIITTVIPTGSNIALLDEPVHRNIGDHLIHLGTERFFSDHGISQIARAHTYNYRRRWLRQQIDVDTIIVCSGGGHLGDLYPAHQRLREQVVVDFPDHRIVVLPQSLYFKDAAHMRRAAAVFRGHRDFHLFLRDRDSLRQAETMNLHSLRLAPDMAHALYPIASPSASLRSCGETLYLLRRDMEGSTSSPTLADGRVIRDWPDLMRITDTFVLAAIAATSRLYRAVGSSDFLDDVLDQRRAEMVKRGIGLINGYDQIVSSRLHGAILGLLLGRRVRLLASLTGKSRAYYDAWLSDNEDCTYVSEGL